jgi:hypothetical protein
LKSLSSEHHRFQESAAFRDPCIFRPFETFLALTTGDLNFAPCAAVFRWPPTGPQWRRRGRWRPATLLAVWLKLGAGRAGSPLGRAPYSALGRCDWPWLRQVSQNCGQTMVTPKLQSFSTKTLVVHNTRVFEKHGAVAQTRAFRRAAGFLTPPRRNLPSAFHNLRGTEHIDFHSSSKSRVGRRNALLPFLAHATFARPCSQCR